MMTLGTFHDSCKTLSDSDDSSLSAVVYSSQSSDQDVSEWPTSSLFPLSQWEEPVVQVTEEIEEKNSFYNQDDDSCDTSMHSIFMHTSAKSSAVSLAFSNASLLSAASDLVSDDEKNLSPTATMKSVTSGVFSLVEAPIQTSKQSPAATILKQWRSSPSSVSPIRTSPLGQQKRSPPYERTRFSPAAAARYNARSQSVTQISTSSPVASPLKWTNTANTPQRPALSPSAANHSISKSMNDSLQILDDEEAMWISPAPLTRQKTLTLKEESDKVKNSLAYLPRYPKSNQSLAHWHHRRPVPAASLATTQESSKLNRSHSISFAQAPTSVAPSSPTHRTAAVLRRNNTECSKTNNPPKDRFQRIRRTQSQCYSEDAFVAQSVTHSASFSASTPASLSMNDTVPDDCCSETGERYQLPHSTAKSDAMKRLSVETMRALLDQEYSHLYDTLHIIDCRFPFEFQGGHIRGALNLNAVEECEALLRNAPPPGHRVIVVFHCEYSSVRAPRMAAYLRSRDRQLHLHTYPRLAYPELYILQGGYRDFFASHQRYCEPPAYVAMCDEQFSAQLKVEMREHRRVWQRARSFSDVQGSAVMRRSSASQLFKENHNQTDDVPRNVVIDDDSSCSENEDEEILQSNDLILEAF